MAQPTRAARRVMRNVILVLPCGAVAGTWKGSPTAVREILDGMVRLCQPAARILAGADEISADDTGVPSDYPAAQEGRRNRR
jgi:hypothetical protein